MAEVDIPVSAKLPNNSNRAKREEAKKAEIAMSRPKKSATLVDAKVIDNRPGSIVKDYVVDEVIMPNIISSADSIASTLISAMADSLTGIVKTFLFGENKKDSKETKYTSYRRYVGRSHPRLYEPPWDDVRPTWRNVPDSRMVRDIEFDTREEVEDCLAEAYDIIEEYGQISVAKFYDICGITTVMTQNDYGWDDLSRIRIRAGRSKWLLELPPASPLR